MFDFNLFSGIIFVLLLGSLAAKYGLISHEGILASIIIGLAIYVFGGLNWFVLLGAFFLLATVAGKYKSREKKETEKEFEKGGTRDFWQVGANGAFAALIAVVHHFFPFAPLYFAFLGTIATVTADTVATEVGVLSRTAYLVTNFKKVPRGVSGGVSLLGLGVSLVSALLIGLFAVAVNQVLPSTNSLKGAIWLVILVTTASGFFGSLADSLLGATLQVMYYCPKCRRETEKEVHKCGTRTRYVKGLKIVNNDTVNLLSSMAGAVFAVILYFLLK